MSTTLFLSPHLDDVAFSCGATVAKLARDGRAVVATMFTASVAAPRGFALACQTDKGLPEDADYMAIRRAEDAQAARLLGAASVRHAPFVEAPHRGYASAAALFAPPPAADDIWRSLRDAIDALLRELTPARVYVPQAIGGHVDHVQVVRAFVACGWPGEVHWYRDAPYVIRDPDGRACELVPAAGEAWVERIQEADLVRKVSACAAYATQIPFQFGDDAALREALFALGRRDASPDAGYAERTWRAT